MQEKDDNISEIKYSNRKRNYCNDSEPCEMEEKIANHACMNERFFLEFHMASSHIEMQRSGIEMWL